MLSTLPVKYLGEILFLSAYSYIGTAFIQLMPDKDFQIYTIYLTLPFCPMSPSYGASTALGKPATSIDQEVW